MELLDHLLNCGFPLKVSGETDFPCMSGTRVGQGRVYVQLGQVDRLYFTDWCRGLAEGRSYVSDGYAHALEFQVNGRPPGETVALPAPQTVTVRARVAFSSETPIEPPYGGVIPVGGARLVGYTVNLHDPAPGSARSDEQPMRRVELVMNGQPVAVHEVPADDREHLLEFELPVETSSWIALRHFPQMHTNPVDVIVQGKPILASKASARWVIECIQQLWRVRGGQIAAGERQSARETFDLAIEKYRQIAAEAQEGT